MHEAFGAYIRHGKALASGSHLDWDFELDEEGNSQTGWNLNQLTGATLPPIYYLRDLGTDTKTLEFMNLDTNEQEKIPIKKRQLDPDWQDLIKAAAYEQLLYKRSTPLHASNGVIRPLKILATCCSVSGTKPWVLIPELVDRAVIVAQQIQNTGQLSDTILGVTKSIIDTNHLALACPLHPALSVKRIILNGGNRRSKVVKSKNDLLDSLEKRKNQQKLPEQRAFWELIRIVFTEQPKTYTDALRFAALKVMLITGLRIGEAVRLPADWKRTREYYDPSGKPAGALGGYSTSLLLRHFAEKQQTERSDSVALYENTQYVPAMFEEILTETLDKVISVTQPLRDTLKMQCETGRLFLGTSHQTIFR